MAYRARRAGHSRLSLQEGRVRSRGWAQTGGSGSRRRYGVERFRISLKAASTPSPVSARLVLAGTFSTLAVLPLVFLTEIGFVIAVGVLIDTFVVRSLLVPALVLEIGDRVWWPSALEHLAGRRGEEPAAGRIAVEGES
jgi:MMPL family